MSNGNIFVYFPILSTKKLADAKKCERKKNSASSKRIQDISNYGDTGSLFSVPADDGV
jgi:hypothetical protein